MKRVALLLLLLPNLALALGKPSYIATAPTPGAFPIVQSKKAADIYVDPADWPGVLRAANNLRADIERVTGVKPTGAALTPTSILIGTIGHSPMIDRLVAEKKLDVSQVAGKWEAFVIQTIGKTLVIAGSDKRGTIYGIYDLSEQIGVSPWYFWADVPTPHKDALFVRSGRYMEGEPAVKYRGIFLNDEAPALSGWVKEKHGTYNHQFYETVFELILRLKGNYLWPAMWGSAFNEDDALSPRIADEYGIVMGTTHHEPMLRAQQEWKRHGTGPWDYAKNPEVLRKFWEEGVRRNKDFESIISIGMRGDGDMPMAGTSLDANVALLEEIVADQRAILAKEVNPNLAAIPQLWALYKEVQGYYEKGMRVPDDVTLLWCDDNWGNIRRLPTPEERKRAGGAGIYYHFDYVGGPRNYKWINTNPIPKVWEQMNLALQYGADRIWIVNVGDLKPMEFPIEFFLNLARDPSRWPKEKLSAFTHEWAEREFGPQYAAEIADLVSKTLKYNGRRKPELLDPTTYSLTDYQEAERVSMEYQVVVAKAEEISRKLPANVRDAFFELVTHPAKAAAQVTDLYIAAGKNRLYASQGRASANGYAARTRALFQADADLTSYFNQTLAGGKWNHMMDQTHIGYTYWQEPRVNAMPAVQEIELPAEAKMGVAAESLNFDVFNNPRRYIDVYNQGQAPFDYTALPTVPWIVLSESRGKVEKETRLWASVDWKKAPKGTAVASIEFTGPAGQKTTIPFRAFNPETHPTHGFVEADGYVSIEPEHFTKKIDTPAAHWEKLPDYGKTLSAMTLFPVTAPSVTPPQAAPCLEYDMYLFDPAQVEVESILGPTQNFVPGRGLRFAISFDDQAPQIVDALAKNALRDWETTVKDSERKVKSAHTLTGTGYHTLKFCMVDPGVVLQKLVVNLGGLKPSYLGPPESYRAGASSKAH